MKYATIIGVLLGFLLAVGALWDGVVGFLVVLVLCGVGGAVGAHVEGCLLYTSPSPRDRTRSRMPSSA